MDFVADKLVSGGRDCNVKMQVIIFRLGLLFLTCVLDGRINFYNWGDMTRSRRRISFPVILQLHFD